MILLDTVPYCISCIHLQLGECPTLFQPGEKIPVKFSGDGAKFSRTSNMMILSFCILVPQGRYLSGTGKCVCVCVCVCECGKGGTVRKPYM